MWDNSKGFGFIEDDEGWDYFLNISKVRSGQKIREGDKVKLIRFGAQGADTKPPRKGESMADKAKRKSFKARHAKNIAKGKMSAAFWADKTKWS